MHRSFKVMIVEDEILIAHSLERYLLKKGYEVIGIAISYEEAVQLYDEKQPDLTLLDIRLSGEKTGIDVAHFIQNSNTATPFLFLTSQMDRNNIAKAKETFPAGYLSKPIRRESLYATIEVALYKYLADKEESVNESVNITLFDGNKNHNVSIEDILFLQAEHIYVQVHFKNGLIISPRISLKELLTQLPETQFIQTHRSFVININNVSSWDNESIYFDEETIPISRSRKKTVHSYLKKAE